MNNKINFYQDKEEPDAIFKYNWDTDTGYIWNYREKKWIVYDRVIDEIMNGGNLRCLKEEAAKKAIEENS